MACTPTPTETLYHVLTTTTSSTSFVEVITTIPPELSTFTTTFCANSTLDASNSTVCLLTATSDAVTTIHLFSPYTSPHMLKLRAEEVQTTQSPLVSQVRLTISDPTNTLFSTCPPDKSTPNHDPSVSSNTSNTTSTQPPPTPTSSTSVFQSTIVTQLSSTLADGSVVVSMVTLTSTFTSIGPSLLGGSQGNNSGQHGVRGDLGSIIGAIVGGFIGLIVLAVLILLTWRKRDSLSGLYSRDLIFAHNDHLSWSHRARVVSPSPDPEPKPYQLGDVGLKISSTSHQSSLNISPAPTRPRSSAFPGLSPRPNAAEYYTSVDAYAPSQTGDGLPTASDFTRPLTFKSNSLLPPTRSDIPPITSPSLPPALPGASASAVSVGTAVSYPYAMRPVRESVEAESDSDRRRPVRLSLTLANWNPETDGELYPRANEDDGVVGDRDTA